MKIDAGLRAQVEAVFAPLNDIAAANAFPPPAFLSQTLGLAIIPSKSKGPTSKNLTPQEAKMFGTAAVDMWMRAVHSFLVSASLSTISPIWASTAGYYSSHYAVRAVAHLLGFFQLFTRKRIARLEIRGRTYVCSFDAKGAGDREHHLYWKIVKKDPHFAGDPFFTENPAAGDESDIAHRNYSNYADHLPRFEAFRPLDRTALRNRIDKISDIEVTAPPIPRVSRWPDVDSVQIIAYHRLVRFRDLVDSIVGNENRFWRFYRNPSWARDFMDFQLTTDQTLPTRFASR